MKQLKFLLVILAVGILAGGLADGAVAAPAEAQQEDVTFFVVGKHANFDQLPNGDLEPVDFSFFSEIFLTADGDADNAFMNMPTGERIRFRDQRPPKRSRHT